MTRVRVLIALCMSVAEMNSAAAAQQRPVAWTGVVTSSHAVAPGATVTLKVSAKIDAGWHLYSITQGPGGPIPTHIDVAPGQPFTLASPVHGPALVKRFDSNFGIEVEMYDGAATFEVPVRVARDAPAGATVAVVTARYQACNATLCMPPYSDKVSVAVTVAPATASRTSTAMVVEPIEAALGV